MKNRGNYALLAAFFVGLVALWWADRARIPTQADRERARGRVLPALIDARALDVRKIEIGGAASDPPLVLERAPGDRWRMTSPLRVEADPSKAEDLAFALKELTGKPEAGTIEADPAAFDLAPPRKTIRVWGGATDAPLATLELGKTSLGRLYVRAGGARGIEVVDAQKLQLAELSPDAWRDRELFRVPSFEVDGIKVVRRGGGGLDCRRDPDGWRITRPFPALADEGAVDGLIADLGSVRVTVDDRFVADDVKPADLGRYGLADPALRIVLNAGRRGSRSIDVGGPVEGKESLVYVRRDDQDDILAVDGRVFKALGAEPNAYRSQKVADLGPGRVTHIRVQQEGAEFDVELPRPGGEWRITKPNPARADRQAVQKFLKALDDLKTGIYLTPSSVPDSGLDRPAYTLKVWHVPDPRRGLEVKTEADLPTFTLKVGRRDAGKRVYFGQVEGDPTILGLPDTMADFLPKSPLAFRDRQVLAIDADSIARLELAGKARRVVLRPADVRADPVSKAPIRWMMFEPAQADTDPEAIARLLKLLGNLRADIFVIDKSEDLARFGLDDPALTLTWTIPAPPPDKPPVAPGPGPAPVPVESQPLVERSLTIGNEVPSRKGTRFAKMSGDPSVFTLTAETLAVLDDEFRDRRVMNFNPARLRRIRFAWPDREFNVVPVAKDGALRWAPGGPVDLVDFDTRKVSPLIKEASNLLSGRYAQYAGPFPVEAGLSTPRVSMWFDFDDNVPSQLIRIGANAGKDVTYATASRGAEGPVFFLTEAPFADWLHAPRREGDLPANVFAPE